MKYTIFCRLGMMILALSLMFAGCKQPAETNYAEASEEENERLSEITGFTFTQTNPLRAAYAVKEKTVGRFNNPIGGTAPFSYALVIGNGINDTDNILFTVSGDSLKIQADQLAARKYFIYLNVTDSKGESYSQAVTVTVTSDPVVLDQETRTVRGINFKMRYVPSGVFVEPTMDRGDIEVIVPIGFWMAETETTQELYQLIMGENPSQFKDNPAFGEIQSRRPVENVSLYEALLFCNRLSVAVGKEPVYHVWGVLDWGKYLQWAVTTSSSTAIHNIYVDEKANGYRLPNSAEWYWAAMGANAQNPKQVNSTGIKKLYAGGTVENGTGIGAGIGFYAWYSLNSLGITHEVGKKLSNELGFFDMTGNVNEWIWEGIFRGGNWAYAGNFPFYLIYGGPQNYERVLGCGFRILSNQ
ncbi:MAG: formylglycine-generating enzyme family protein [Treponema sp.]|jgi:formylglycine-generating enzyme required for sulfatase activity|nr:formylglycine-generating enzyme family protein [Treponema sp.]